MRIKPNIPKGTRDLLPIDILKRNYILDIVKNTFERCAFSPIETPSMENLDTLNGKYGEEGDRLIFKILNSGDFLSKVNLNGDFDFKNLSNQISSKGLRYDLTIPFARFFSQNRNELTLPFKRYQIQNVWRADKPQKGRFREFLQCDVDVIGTDSLLCEIELLKICDQIFSDLLIPNVKVRINNRKLISLLIDRMNKKELFKEIIVLLDKIDKIGLERVRKEITKIVNDKSSIKILDDFLNISNLFDLESFIGDDAMAKDILNELKFIFDIFSKIKLNAIDLNLDVSLVRGLDYYTGTIIEVFCKDINFGSIVGGGRYDNLTSIFGVDGVSGVGISFGVDRIKLIMDELKLFPENIENNIQVLFINFGIKESILCLKMLDVLRENNIKSEIYPSAAKMKKQMKYANDKKIQYVVLFGENEIKLNLLKVKNMHNGSQFNLTLEDFIKKIS